MIKDIVKKTDTLSFITQHFEAVARGEDPDYNGNIEQAIETLKTVREDIWRANNVYQN